MMWKKHGMVLLTVCLAVLAGRAVAQKGKTGAPQWQAVLLRKATGFNVPECVLVDPAGQLVYISNIEAEKDQYWTNDGKGFITQMGLDGLVKKPRWLNSAPNAVINAPKGMCILKARLYFSDNARLLWTPLDGADPPKEIPLAGAQQLNDLATDGLSVYVSDTAQGVVYKVDEKGGSTKLEAPEGVNGLTCHQGRLFAVSWTLHEVYELDPTGIEAPKPFGLAGHFSNLDGIEVLDDGTFLVSDFTGNKVSAITPDRKSVYTLAELESPADIGVDRANGKLYVPQFMKNQVAALKLQAP